MNDGFSGTALAGLVKVYGLKAVLGMVGAALLYVVLPPLKSDGSYNGREFVLRLAVAGMFSIMFGDMLADVLNHFAPWLQPYKNGKAVDIMAGAPGWWISRAIALAMYRRRGNDIVEIGREVKEKVGA